MEISIKNIIQIVEFSVLTGDNMRVDIGKVIVSFEDFIKPTPSDFFNYWSCHGDKYGKLFFYTLPHIREWIVDRPDAWLQEQFSYSHDPDGTVMIWEGWLELSKEQAVEIKLIHDLPIEGEVECGLALNGPDDEDEIRFGGESE